MKLGRSLALDQVRAVFERHADRHMTVPVAAPPGVVAWWRAGRVEVEVERRGGGPVRLDSVTASAEAGPDATGRVALSLRVAPGAGPLRLLLGSEEVLLTPPDALTVARARRAHIRSFVATLGRALPAGLRWLSARHDPVRVAKLRDALGLAHVQGAGLLDPARLSPDPAPPALRPDRPVVVVLAVFNAFDLLPEVLDRLERHTDLPFDLVVIEDASTDPRVRPWLRARLAGSGARVTLIENPGNLGFVASANLGLSHALARGAHAILVNADVFVPPGWASRLMRPLLAAPDRVASVTPLSGASGLTTVPVIGPGASLPPGVSDALDRVAQHRFGPRTVDLPTGMGFCMAMSARFLQRVGVFDTVFGAGYGEETDWCRRAQAVGGQHLGLAGLFVDHRGSASFGREARDRRAIAAASLLRARHPGYEAEVARFVDSDPLLTERMVLGVALLAGQAPEAEVTVYLAHALGGGAEANLQERLATHRRAGQGAVVLRVGGVRRWGLEVHGPGPDILRAMTDDAEVVRSVLGVAGRRRLIYSCGVGDRDPAGLPGVLLSLLTGPDDRLDVLMHDHFPLSPSFTLLGADGWFHGLPEADSLDPAHQSRWPDGRVVPLRDWREVWGALMRRADRIEVFSPSSAALVQAAWPGEALRIKLCPHVVAPLPGVPVARGGRALGILGNIRAHKGAGVLLALAQVRPDLRLVLVGTLDIGVRPPPNLRVLGGYAREDIATIAQEQDIGVWLIPSIWPETFCYALHEALATGLPTLAFALGAQADALLAAGHGSFVIDPGADAASAAVNVSRAVDALLSPV